MNVTAVRFNVAEPPISTPAPSPVINYGIGAVRDEEDNKRRLTFAGEEDNKRR